MNLQEFNGHFISTQGKECIITTDGIEKTYAVMYQPHLSKDLYPRKHVYYIKTDVENYNTAKKDILSLMYSLFGYKNMTTAKTLEPYYKFTFNKELDMFEFVYIESYDD